MIWGGIATIVGMIFQPLGQILAWVAWVFLEWTIVIVQSTASVPFASLDIGRLDILFVVACYIVLFGASRLNLGSIRSHVTFRPALTTGAAFIVGVLIWNAYTFAPDGRMRVVFTDASGAATFVQTPSGNKILIDGGDNPSALLSTIGQYVPFWDHQIDLVVLTSAEDSYLSGLSEVIERYEVKQIVQVNAPAKTSAAYLKWRDLIAQKQISTLPARSGLQMVLDRGVLLEFLNPSNDAPESSGAIVQLRAGNVAFLFAEGASTDDQSALVKTNFNIESAVLIAPKKIAPEFFDAVNPQFGIVFAGKTAKDKTSTDLLTVLSRTTVLQTDERGTVEIIVNEQGIAMKTTR